FTNYEAAYMSTNSSIIPSLATQSTASRLIGTCALPSTNSISPNTNNSYTNIILDVYTLDPEGWTNGMKFAFSELEVLDTNNAVIFTNGFPQGKTYLGSFKDNGPNDSDPA